MVQGLRSFVEGERVKCRATLRSVPPVPFSQLLYIASASLSLVAFKSQDEEKKEGEERKEPPSRIQSREEWSGAERREERPNGKERRGEKKESPILRRRLPSFLPPPFRRLAAAGPLNGVSPVQPPFALSFAAAVAAAAFFCHWSIVAAGCGRARRPRSERVLLPCPNGRISGEQPVEKKGRKAGLASGTMGTASGGGEEVRRL